MVTLESLCIFYKYQIRSVAQSCPTLCDPVKHALRGRDRVLVGIDRRVDDRKRLIEESASRIVVVHRHLHPGEEIVLGGNVGDRDRLAAMGLAKDADLDRKRVGARGHGEERDRDQKHEERPKRPRGNLGSAEMMHGQGAKVGEAQRYQKGDRKQASEASRTKLRKANRIMKARIWRNSRTDMSKRGATSRDRLRSRGRARSRVE